MRVFETFFFNIADKVSLGMLADQYGDALKQDFGVTPEWYNREHNISL